MSIHILRHAHNLISSKILEARDTRPAMVSVCLPMHLSQAGILSKQLQHAVSVKQCHTTAYRLFFWRQLRSWWNSDGITPNGATKCKWG